MGLSIVAAKVSLSLVKMMQFPNLKIVLDQNITFIQTKTL